MSVVEKTTAARKIEPRIFDRFRYSPAAENAALEKIDREERALRSDPSVCGQGANLSERFQSDRHEALTALPPHLPLVELKELARRPDLARGTDIAPPFATSFDQVTQNVDGHFESRDEAPLTDLHNGLIGSRFKAVAMDPGRVTDRTAIQYARESGLILNAFNPPRPARLALNVRLRLQSGWHKAIYFDRRPGAVYVHIYQYHLPFITIAPPIPANHVHVGSYPGLHGVLNFWSVTDGREHVINTPPAETAWNHGEVTLRAETADVLEPDEAGIGYCLTVGVRHMVQVLANNVRFEVDSGAQWRVESVRVEEL